MGIYSYELFKEYDVENIIRIGSCGGYLESLKLNDVVLVTESHSDSNYAIGLDDYEKDFITSSSDLNLVIEETVKNQKIRLVKGNIFCSDNFYKLNSDYKNQVKEKNVLGVEMETFALFNNARYFGKKATALLTVTDFVFFIRKT